MKLNVIVSEYVPKDKLFVADSKALSELQHPADVVRRALALAEEPHRTVICPDERTARKIRRAAKGVAGIKLDAGGTEGGRG